MPEDGADRPRPVRRLLIALARAVALFILVTGIYGALGIALPQWAVLNRSIAALLVGVTIFETLRPSRRRAVAPSIPQETPPPVVIDNSAELAEARATNEKLRDALETARNRESEIRSEYERESEHVQRAASRALEEIQRTRAAHDELRVQLESERGRVAAAQQEIEKLRGLETRLASAREDLEQSRAAHDELRTQLESERGRSAGAQQEIEKLRKLERRLAATMEELEKSRAVQNRLTSTMQEMDALRAERQRVTRELEQIRQAREVDKAKLADLQRELDLTHATSQKLVQTNETVKKQFDDERQRLQTELQRVQSDRDAMQSEARSVASRVDELIAQLDRERKLSQELAATRAELDQENASLRQRIEQLDTEWSAKLQQLAADHEANVTAATGERDALQKQIELAAGEHERALKKLDNDWSAKLQKIVNGMTADHENDIGEAIAKREEARAEARSLQLKIARLEDNVEALKEQLEASATPAVDEKALRDKIDLEWSEKLQKIVNGLTVDHENDIGEAIARREEARAEARALQAKIARLESQIEAHATAPMPAMIDESALREKIDAEWSAKLQTIVSHIASDHEADVGKAIEEREAARAEVRNLNIKITSLQQKLEAERQARESLQTRFREAEDQLRNAPTQPLQALPEEQKARADVLEFAEQAFEALKRATSPGTVPVPAVEEKKARILIVHHDPRFRSMWHEFLEKNGFAVQTAADGVEGLRVVKSEKPDAVIADAAMPKMDGRELCQMIKSDPETSEVKVILLSGMYTNEMLQPERSEYEPDELLRKPVKLDAMKAALANLLAARLAS